MLSVNQIYKDKVKKYKTPFDEWLNAEKANFAKRHKMDANENKKKFETYLNKRYNMAKPDFWHRESNAIGIITAPINDLFERGLRDAMNMTTIEEEKDEWDTKKETKQGDDVKPIDLTQKDTSKTEPKKPAKTVPFLKRQIIGMKVSNALLGLGALAVVISVSIAVANYKKSKQSK